MKSAAHSLSILRQFTHDRPTRSVSEISRALKMDKANVHRHLRELADQGFVEQERETRRYNLGHAVVALAGVKLAQRGLFDVARPHLDRLCGETGETVQLSVMRQRGVFYLLIVESPQPIRVASKLGEYGPLHGTAAGKLFLAFLPPEQQDEILSTPLAVFTPKTLIDPDALRREISTIRRAGVAIDDQGYLAHLRAVAAPVRDISGEIIAAVAVGGPTLRVTLKRLDFLKKRLLDATGRLSRDLGFIEPERSLAAPAAARSGRQRRAAS